MFLTKITMKVEDFVYTNLHNNYILHQFISNIFNESVVFDVEYKNVVEILTFSKTRPSNIPQNVCVKTKEINGVSKGMYKISTKTNIVKHVKEKKYPLVHENDVREYFNVRKELFGFDVTSLSRKGSAQKISFKKKNNEIFCVYQNLEIVVNVFDENAFYNTILSGIGSQKKFGFGLLKFLKLTP